MVFVHDIGRMTHGEKNTGYWKQLETGGYKALQELKAAGVIKAIGLGVNEWEVIMDAFKLGDWDACLLAGRYTLLEQTSLSPFLETCVKRNTSIIVGGPFNGGALMGTGMWNYAKAPQEVVDKVGKLEAYCKAQNVPIGAAALQFPLAHPAVATILPGPKSPAELDGILDWWQVKIPAAFWDGLADQKLVAPGTPLPNGRTA
jgi:D-threo-aldose 1-dehydrogenase